MPWYYIYVICIYSIYLWSQPMCRAWRIWASTRWRGPPASPTRPSTTSSWTRYLSKPMAPILDGNIEIGAHVWTKICNLICLMHLELEQSQIGSLFRKNPVFLHTCARCSELSSNKSAMTLPRTTSTY